MHPSTESRLVTAPSAGRKEAVLIVVSPAKSLDYESPLPTEHSEPRSCSSVRRTRREAQDASPSSRIMGISELARLNHERFQSGKLRSPRRTRGRRCSPSTATSTWASTAGTILERLHPRPEVLRILSGLYGVLRPLDLMQPYRLEMGTPLDRPRHGSLRVLGRHHHRSSSRPAASPGPTRFNLASDEYFGASTRARAPTRQARLPRRRRAATEDNQLLRQEGPRCDGRLDHPQPRSRRAGRCSISTTTATATT